MIPFSGPAADDQPMLVEDPIEKGIRRLGIGREFLIRVEDPGIEIVAVDFDQIAPAVNERHGTFQIVVRSDDRRLDSDFPKGIFEEPIKIRSDDDPDISVSY
jgi:hypothetical protein